jgi:hypothetical protein
MEAGFDPLPLPSLEAAAPAPWRRWGARIAVATTAMVATTLGAAAANALPVQIQNVVAGAVGALTPLELPHRDGDRALGDSGPPLGEESGKQTGPGSDPSPAEVTVPGEHLPQEDLAPRRFEQPSQSPSAQRSVISPVATLDEDGDTDASDPDEAGSPDSGEPDSGEPDSGEPDSGEPGSGEPQVHEPDVDEPGLGGRHLGEADLAEPDLAEPDLDVPSADEAGDEARDSQD